MPRFHVTIERTLTLTATITVTAKDEDDAHDAVQEMIENSEFGTIDWHVVNASRHPDWEEDSDDMTIDAVNQA